MRERADDRGKRVTVEAKTRRRWLYRIIALTVDANVVALVWAGVEVHVYVCLAVDWGEGGPQGAGFGFASCDDAILERVGFTGGWELMLDRVELPSSLLDTYLDKILQRH